MNARESLLQIAHEAGVSLEFPAAVTAEVGRIDLGAALAEPALSDWTHLPFVTIDGPTSRDLDQALHVERSASHFVVRYALADAAHFVPKHSALFEEALVRGASVYFPGFSAPMLPRELSEGVVSLNPDGPRRALAFEIEIDDAGKVQQSRVVRVRIESRAKLSFPEVQRFYDDEAQSPLRGRDYEDSLLRLREVGVALAEEARQRDVARYRRTETELVLREDEGGSWLDLIDSPRAAVELYNEQLSLLVNREGARMLSESPLAHVEPIYRVHPAPPEERMHALCVIIAGIVAAHGLDESWLLSPTRERLTDYLDRLPHDGALGRIAAAIHRQAIVVNARSSFSSDPGAHHGVGAEAYARYSAPMREVVGVFVHHEMLELLTASGGADPQLRTRVVEAANRSKDVQRKVNELTFRLFLDGLLSRDAALPQGERPRRSGTVMGLTSSKLHVALDDPRADVKLYLRDIGRALGAARSSAAVWLAVSEDGATLRERDSGAVLLRVGDPVQVWLEGKDERQDRWILQLSS